MISLTVNSFGALQLLLMTLSISELKYFQSNGQLLVENNQKKTLG